MILYFNINVIKCNAINHNEEIGKRIQYRNYCTSAAKKSGKLKFENVLQINQENLCSCIMTILSSAETM